MARIGDCLVAPAVAPQHRFGREGEPLPSDGPADQVELAVRRGGAPPDTMSGRAEALGLPSAAGGLPGRPPTGGWSASRGAVRVPSPGQPESRGPSGALSDAAYRSVPPSPCLWAYAARWKMPRRVPQ